MNSRTALPRLTLCELADPGIPGVETFSPFCMKVHRALRTLDLAYERRHAVNPASFAALNPTGQVPILLVDGDPIADSTAIVRWLDEKSGGRLVPRDARLAAEAWLWEELADTSLNGYFVAARWADEANWPLVEEAYFNAMPRPVRWIVPGRARARILGNLRSRDVIRRSLDDCWDRYQRQLDALDARAPSEGFWLGDALTVADLALFGQLHGMRTPLTARQREWIAARPRLTAWLDRVNAATRLDVTPAQRAAA